jgi:hypothetical protein
MMFMRCPSLFIQERTTDSGVRWPAAMFSASADQPV